MLRFARPRKRLEKKHAFLETRGGGGPPLDAVQPEPLVLLARTYVAKFPALFRPFLPYPALTRLFQFRLKDFNEICLKSQ